MGFLALLGNIAFGTVKKVLHGYISREYLLNLADFYAGNGIIFFFMTLSYVPFLFFEPFPSPVCVVLGILNGLSGILFQIFTSRAMCVGSVSLTVLITSFSLVPPIIFSMIVMNESLHIFQIVGLLLLAVTFFLTVKPEKNVRVNMKWLLLAAAAYFFTSACNIIAKLRVLWTPDDSINWFLALGTAASTVFALFVTRGTIQRQNVTLSFKMISRATLLMFICAVDLAINNYCSAVANDLVPGTILFPAVNGGLLVATMTVSAFLFKERYTRRQWAGVIIGLISLLLICDVIGI